MNAVVIGAGPAGLAMAGDLALAGIRVALHDTDPERVGAVAAAGGIRLTGRMEGFAPVQVATCDLGAAAPGADAAVIVVPAPALAQAVAALGPHLERGSLLVLATGGTGAALEARAILRAAGVAHGPVAEVAAFPFTCALDGPASVRVDGVKKTFGVATLDGDGMDHGLERLLARGRSVPSVLHTSLSNMNSVLHVAPMVLNAGWIESDAPFEFYGDGISPAVAAVVATYDAERLAVARALGIDLPSLQDWAATAYGIAEADVFRLVQALQREVYRALPAPPSLHHRFLTEDVPCGTVPVASLGAALAVPVPVHSLLVELASLLCGIDFATAGRTVSRLGLDGLDADGIRETVGLATRVT